MGRYYRVAGLRSRVVETATPSGRETVAGRRFDVIVVGSGASGGTLAARLSEDAGRRVLMVEAGRDFPAEATAPPSFITGGALTGERGAGAGPPAPEYDWGYESEPLAGGRRVELWRGRLVGGTSMTNGSVAVRGRPSDFDAWEQAGGPRWGWEAFRRAYESVERELSVGTYPRDRWLPVQHLLVDACQEAGFRYAEDLNAPDAWDGVVGPWPRSRREELRQGSLNTYVRQARPRANFTILDRAHVDRVLFDGSRAVGVRAIVDGEPVRIEGDRVALCAGAYGSAPILLRSGIGPAAALRRHGIGPLVDLPVGAHLMEHPALTVLAKVAPEYALIGWPALAAVARGNGYWCIPMPCSEREGIVMFNVCLATVDGPPGGRISLASADPVAPPRIHVGLEAAADAGAFEPAWEELREVFATSAFRRAGHRDPEGERPLRERLWRRIGVGYHAAGGCDLGAVVDADLAVHGVERLHVADAGVFPRHVTNNPMLTCFAVGEIAAARLAQS